MAPKLKGSSTMGGKEVYRQDQGGVVRQAVDCGVIPGLDTHQQLGVSDYRHMVQDLDQVLGAELGSSTCAVGQAGQPDLFLAHIPPFTGVYKVDYSTLDTGGRSRPRPLTNAPVLDC